jgi:hypothetical protein
MFPLRGITDIPLSALHLRFRAYSVVFHKSTFAAVDDSGGPDLSYQSISGTAKQFADPDVVLNPGVLKPAIVLDATLDK